MKTMTGTSYKATTPQGEMIIIEASHEALQDYGEAAVKHKASAKYDAGQVENNKVTVRTTDFS